MVSRNDLSAFKKREGQEVLKAPGPKRVGRPPVKEKRTYKVTLSFTELEREALQAKA